MSTHRISLFDYDINLPPLIPNANVILHKTSKNNWPASHNLTINVNKYTKPE